MELVKEIIEFLKCIYDIIFHDITFNETIMIILVIVIISLCFII